MITQKWKNEELKLEIKNFYDVYSKKPISNNDGGMKFPHMFLTWFLIKTIKPKYLIESGVWRGLGTWIIEQASPDTKIFSIDPNPQYRIYTSSRVEYFTEDFSKLNFDINPDETLVFFDDHQNSLDRIKQSKSKNFNKLIFEDNYPHTQGDCYSIKKILSGNDFIMDYAGNRIHYQANLEDKEYLLNTLKVYQEMPPIYCSTYTRWGTPWSEYQTPEALLNDNEIEQYKDVKPEMNDYTWLCYVEI